MRLSHVKRFPVPVTGSDAAGHAVVRSGPSPGFSDGTRLLLTGPCEAAATG